MNRIVCVGSSRISYLLINLFELKGLKRQFIPSIYSIFRPKVRYFCYYKYNVGHKLDNKLYGNEANDPTYA